MASGSRGHSPCSYSTTTLDCVRQNTPQHRVFCLKRGSVETVLRQNTLFSWQPRRKLEGERRDPPTPPPLPTSPQYSTSSNWAHLLVSTPAGTMGLLWETSHPNQNRLVFSGASSHVSQLTPLCTVYQIGNCVGFRLTEEAFGAQWFHHTTDLSGPQDSPVIFPTLNGYPECLVRLPTEPVISILISVSKKTFPQIPRTNS